MHSRGVHGFPEKEKVDNDGFTIREYREQS